MLYIQEPMTLSTQEFISSRLFMFFSRHVVGLSYLEKIFLSCLQKGIVELSNMQANNKRHLYPTYHLSLATIMMVVK